MAARKSSMQPSKSSTPSTTAVWSVPRWRALARARSLSSTAPGRPRNPTERVRTGPPLAWRSRAARMPESRPPLRKATTGTSPMVWRCTAAVSRCRTPSTAASMLAGRSDSAAAVGGRSRGETKGKRRRGWPGSSWPTWPGGKAVMPAIAVAGEAKAPQSAWPCRSRRAGARATPAARKAASSEPNSSPSPQGSSSRGLIPKGSRARVRRRRSPSQSAQAKIPSSRGQRASPQRTKPSRITSVSAWERKRQPAASSCCRSSGAL